MPGEWIKRKKAEHVCVKPRLDIDEHSSGDQWRCLECGGVWVVDSSQRDGLYWRNGKPQRFDKGAIHNSLAAQRAMSEGAHEGPYGYGANPWDR